MVQNVIDFQGNNGTKSKGINLKLTEYDAKIDALEKRVAALENA